MKEVILVLTLLITSCNPISKPEKLAVEYMEYLKTGQISQAMGLRCMSKNLPPPIEVIDYQLDSVTSSSVQYGKPINQVIFRIQTSAKTARNNQITRLIVETGKTDDVFAIEQRVLKATKDMVPPGFPPPPNIERSDFTRNKECVYSVMPGID